MPSNSIVISNHTDKPIVITTIQDSLVADCDRKKSVKINPKDSCVFFTDRVESMSWEKSKV